MSHTSPGEQSSAAPTVPAGPATGRRRGHVSVGQATVEFLMVSLVMLPMALGLIELGRGVWYYNQLSQLSREGARWLIVSSAEGRTDFKSNGNLGLIGNANAYSDYTVSTCSCPGTTVDWIGRSATGIPTSDLKVRITRGTYTSGGPTWGIPVTVKVSYDYKPIATHLIGLPTVIPLTSSTTMHLQ